MPLPSALGRHHPELDFMRLRPLLRQSWKSMPSLISPRVWGSRGGRRFPECGSALARTFHMALHEDPYGTGILPDFRCRKRVHVFNALATAPPLAAGRESYHLEVRSRIASDNWVFRRVFLSCIAAGAAFKRSNYHSADDLSTCVQLGLGRFRKNHIKSMT